MMVAQEPQEFAVHAKAEVTLLVKATTPHEALRQWFAMVDKWSRTESSFVDDLYQRDDLLVSLCGGPPEHFVGSKLVNEPGTVVVTDFADETVFLVADNQKWVPGFGPESPEEQS